MTSLSWCKEKPKRNQRETKGKQSPKTSKCRYALPRDTLGPHLVMIIGINSVQLCSPSQEFLQLQLSETSGKSLVNGESGSQHAGLSVFCRNPPVFPGELSICPPPNSLKVAHSMLRDPESFVGSSKKKLTPCNPFGGPPDASADGEPPTKTPWASCHR